MGLKPAVNWPLGPGVTVVEVGPEGLYALAKPEGVRSQPKEGSRDAKALLTCSYSLKDEAYHLPPDKGGGKVWLLHRLDGGTSGVILVARTACPGWSFFRSWVTCPLRKRSRSTPVRRRRVRGPGSHGPGGDLIFWRRSGFIRVVG